jgi:hypothetical protein
VFLPLRRRDSRTIENRLLVEALDDRTIVGEPGASERLTTGPSQ